MVQGVETPHVGGELEAEFSAPKAEPAPLEAQATRYEAQPVAPEALDALPITVGGPDGLPPETPAPRPEDGEMHRAPSDALALVEPAGDVVVGPLPPEATNPVDAYLDRLTSPDARRTAEGSLRRALRCMDADPERWRTIRWATLGPRGSRALYRRLVDGYKPATVRLTLTMVRGVLQQALTLGQIDADRFARVVGRGIWPKVGGKSADVGRALSPSEIAQLEAYCNRIVPPERGTMVWAMLGCGFAAGLRRFEIARLRADALSDDARHLLLVGKGRKEAVQPIPPALGGAIEAWLATREELGVEDPFMFVPWIKTAPQKGPFGVDGIKRVVAHASKFYGGPRFTPHDLRRTYGTIIVKHHGLGGAKTLLRHENIATTIRYDKGQTEHAEEVAAGLDEHLFGGSR